MTPAEFDSLDQAESRLSASTGPHERAREHGGIDPIALAQARKAAGR